MGAGSSSSNPFIREAARIRLFLDEAQRDPATFHFAKRVYLAVDEDSARARSVFENGLPTLQKRRPGPSVSIWGSSAECTEKIQEIVRAGAQHIVFNPMFDEMEAFGNLRQRDHATSLGERILTTARTEIAK